MNFDQNQQSINRNIHQNLMHHERPITFQSSLAPPNNLYFNNSRPSNYSNP
jgi:hypothetical protein